MNCVLKHRINWLIDYYLIAQYWVLLTPEPRNYSSNIKWFVFMVEESVLATKARQTIKIWFDFHGPVPVINCSGRFDKHYGGFHSLGEWDRVNLK